MIFVDMDGTVAKFYRNKNALEDMYKEGFFLNLKPYKLAKYINNLAKKRMDICILSACVDTPFCKKEKDKWLKKYMPNVSYRCYVDVGENKAEAVAQNIAKIKEYYCLKNIKDFILIDDYSLNLHKWEMYNLNFKAIKFLNGINNKKGMQYTYKFKKFSTLLKIIQKIEKS